MHIILTHRGFGDDTKIDNPFPPHPIEGTAERVSGWPIRLNRPVVTSSGGPLEPGDYDIVTSGDMPSGLPTNVRIHGPVYKRPADWKPINDTWVRLNRGVGPQCGRALYPCFDLEADRTERAQGARRVIYTVLFWLIVGMAGTWAMWSGH